MVSDDSGVARQRKRAPSLLTRGAGTSPCPSVAQVHGCPRRMRGLPSAWDAGVTRRVHGRGTVRVPCRHVRCPWQWPVHALPHWHVQGWRQQRRPGGLWSMPTYHDQCRRCCFVQLSVRACRGQLWRVRARGCVQGRGAASLNTRWPVRRLPCRHVFGGVQHQPQRMRCVPTRHAHCRRRQCHISSPVRVPQRHVVETRVSSMLL